MFHSNVTHSQRVHDDITSNHSRTGKHNPEKFCHISTSGYKPMCCVYIHTYIHVYPEHGLISVYRSTVDGCEILHHLNSLSQYLEGFNHPFGAAFPSTHRIFPGYPQGLATRPCSSSAER